LKHDVSISVGLNNSIQEAASQQTARCACVASSMLPFADRLLRSLYCRKYIYSVLQAVHSI